jgi:hypothetical protein
VAQVSVQRTAANLAHRAGPARKPHSLRVVLLSRSIVVKIDGWIEMNFMS